MTMTTQRNFNGYKKGELAVAPCPPRPTSLPPYTLFIEAFIGLTSDNNAQPPTDKKPRLITGDVVEGEFIEVEHQKESNDEEEKAKEEETS